MTSTLIRASSILLAACFLISCGGSGSGSSSSASNSSSTPNILFVIMDDVGIDQMKSFGYGGTTPPSMPNINAVAAAGIRFRNAWSMPECSPGRASFFVGRYPFRTNIYQAIGQNDLANSQVSPYDMTAPKLLKNAGYTSGLFGKFHLAGPENNNAGSGTPAQLGWDYFYGWVGGLPASIDTTAGGVASTGAYACGFVPTAANGGANTGACYQPNNSCSVIAGSSSSGDAPGKQCLMSGGIFVPGAQCQSTPPTNVNFNTQNAYYVSPLVINDSSGIHSIPVTDSRNRGYRTTIETNAAISWIKAQTGATPWMATVSYTAAHTPLQQPPSSLTPSTPGGGDSLNCGTPTSQRIIQNAITEAMDTEFGRLLVETGLAAKNADGTLQYNPSASNTMIVIVGDNGTLGGSVKAPFNPALAKGTAYQTGIWVPLIVAGPLVNSPNREVNYMTNMVDVYQLFGEIAGLDVPNTVPRVIDSAPMMPYLKNPSQTSIRTMNFGQGGYNIQANGARNAPCVLSNPTGSSCSQIPISKSVCEDNNGVWWGPGYTDSSVIGPSIGPSPSQGYQQCWQVNQALYKQSLHNGTTYTPVNILPEVSTAIRNDNYKLIENQVQVYDTTNDSGTTSVTKEFYTINEDANNPALDTPNSANQLDPTSSSVSAIYDSLLRQLNAILASQPACPGDANIDGQVNAGDLSVWQLMINLWNQIVGAVLTSSVADFNYDGYTNSADAQIIQSHQGVCPKATSVY